MISAIRSLVYALVDLGGRRPWLVLLSALAMLAACWGYASRLEVRSDVLELLPRDSPGFQSFERRLARVGGNATILVVVESPERAANEKIVDAIKKGLDGIVADDKAANRPPSIKSIEGGSKGIRDFFQSNKWLYATVEDLKEAEDKLDHQIALQSGFVSDLEEDDDKPKGKAEHALGMDSFRDKFDKKAKERDDFPSGYFASADGKVHVVRVFTTTSGMGGAGDEELLGRIEAMVAGLRPTSFHPEMKVGYGGDIPNAKSEKDALVHEAVIATAIAMALILGGVVWFYGSPWSLVLVGFPPLFGVGCAYAFATWKYGYVNASGAFLGAIIIGNGVNYPIVLYSRYKEFRARGMEPDVARREAVWNAFRAELVGASVASIAYGSLTVTRFRGFSQFGVIGFVGMLLVWLSMIPCLPALVVVMERVAPKLPAFLREREGKVDDDGTRGPAARFVGELTRRYSVALVALAAIVTVGVCWRLPGFLKDPWEYDFEKLGSENARKGGPFLWSKKGLAVLSSGAKLDGSLVLADKPEQVPLVKARILANDAADPKGSLVESIITADDFLPGDEALQKKKLVILDHIREMLSPGVVAKLTEEEQEKIKEMIPPETLRVLAPKDLPELLLNRFSEKNGTVGTLFYVRYRPEIPPDDGRMLLRMSATIDGVTLPDGTKVDTVSRATIFAEMIRSIERDGPLATVVSFLAVCLVVILATAGWRGAFSVLLSLVLGVAWMLGGAALLGERLNFLNFIALPITFGIGCEYPFNIFDRSRLLKGDVTQATKLQLGAIALCSYTTTIGYGSLLFADNQALRSFGRLAMSGEITCLAGAALFLPALLHLLGRKKPPAAQARADEPTQEAA